MIGKTDELPGRLLVLPADEVLFPSMVIPIAMPPRKQRVLLRQLETDSVIGVVARTAESAAADTTSEPVLYDMGCAGRILRQVKLPGKRHGLMVAGICRIRVEALARDPRGQLVASVSYPQEEIHSPKRVEALVRNIRSSFDELSSLSPWTPEDISRTIAELDDPGQLADFAASSLPLTIEDRQSLLANLVVDERLRRILALLIRETDLAHLGERVQEEVRLSVEKSHREHYLRAQLRAIRVELGEDVDEKSIELQRIRERLVALPPQARQRVEEQLAQATLLPRESSEYQSIRTYLDWLIELPWSISTEDTEDIAKAAALLERSHFGLRDIKERIIELLAVRRLKPERSGAIICLSGPPGVGKTSLGQAVAVALGRKFCRLSLGGIRDEAEIRGHRRTYVNAMPGRIIQALRRVGSNNPVFMLDEVDKVGGDWRGDPASALLEVLDPVQNVGFLDHYLDCPFDLSSVLFMATANVEEEIPPALLDRMEVIRIAGYVDAEKLNIAKRYLVPRQRRAHGLKARQINLTRRVLREIVDGYTDEAGVRELERQIGRICRKVASWIALGQQPADEVTTITREGLEAVLGPRRFAREMDLRTGRGGVAMGLAWTPNGGSILYVESTLLLGGRGKLHLTGLVGKVMNESATIALSHVRANAAAYDIDPDLFAAHDIHIHIPEGAVPKDGPSAGITLASAIISLMRRSGRGQQIKRRVAMTGELTLTGAVLPVGGIKEKVIAAQRAGIRMLILPAENAADLRAMEVPLGRRLQICLVRDLREVAAICLPVRKKAPVVRAKSPNPAPK